MLIVFDYTRVPLTEDDENLAWTTSNKTDNMRNLGELFEQAPTKNSFPAYYEKISIVMDLATIRERVSERANRWRREKKW